MAQLDASINAGLSDEPNDKENKARGNGDSGVGKGGKARQRLQAKLRGLMSMGVRPRVVGGRGHTCN